MDALDRKLTHVFAGKVVRKDLLHQLKGGENVPFQGEVFAKTALFLPPLLPGEGWGGGGQG